MLSDNQFDLVFDCQKIFKSVMNAMAKPGTVFSIKEQSDKLEEQNSVPLAIAMTFMDNRCTVYVDGNDDLLSMIREKTLAVKSDLEKADFVVVPEVEEKESLGVELLDSAKVGTLPEPHKSAMVIVGLHAIEGDTALVLEGPGVKGQKKVTFSQAAAMWLARRETLKYEFPCGTDILFYTDSGEIKGIPRTLKVEVN